MNHPSLLSGIALLAGTGLLMDQACASGPTPLVLSPTNTVIVKPVVVVQPDYEGRAAGLLQQYLRKATGATNGFAMIPATNARDDGRTVLLVLGPSPWADTGTVASLWRDGFAIRRQGNIISICGGRDRGTFHGAVEFLSRFAGVRFYMPGELWISQPADRTVTVPAQVDIRSEPFVKVASLSGFTDPWVDRNALNTRYGLAGTHQHNMNQVFPPAVYSNRCPEVYPIIQGKRYIPKDAKDQSWNPCFTAPQTLDAAEESALRYFAGAPDHLWFCLGLQDSHASCECERCQAAVAAYGRTFAARMKAGNPDGITSTYTAKPETDAADPVQTEKWARSYTLSQLQWKLVNDLAKRLETKAPGKRVEAMAYGITSFAPDFPMHSNAMVFTQIHVSDNIRGLMEPRADGSLPLDRFVDATPAYGNHEWYHGLGHLAPRIYSEYWTRYLRHLKQKNKALVAMHAESYPNWGMDGPKYWVLARTWWDPDLDPAALWRQFCTDMFGAAADPMLRYFQTWERLYIELSVVKGPKWKYFSYPAVFSRTPEDIALVKTCRACLDEAAGLVQTEAEKQRLELFAKTFRLSEYLFDTGANGASPEKAEAIRHYFTTVIQPDPMTLQDRTRRDDRLMEALIPSLVRAQKARTAAPQAGAATVPPAPAPKQEVEDLLMAPGKLPPVQGAARK